MLVYVYQMKRDGIGTTCVGVKEGRFTLIIATSSYVNPKRVYIVGTMGQVLLPLIKSINLS